MRKIRFVISKELKIQLVALNTRGGNYQLAAKKVKEVIGDIKIESAHPLKSLKVTNHGEKRIKHCVKYDLQGYCRLISIHTKGVVFLSFVGTHEECEKWINANKGLEPAIDKQEKDLKNVFISNNINAADKRIADDNDLSEDFLIVKLKEYYIKILSAQISGAQYIPFSKMNSITDEDEILEACIQITDKKIQDLYFDVFMSLKAGKVDEARNRIRLFQEDLVAVEEAKQELLDEAKSNDNYLFLDDFRTQDIETILNHSSWFDWMLFMHPAQRQIVEKDYSGTARLLGVSGSGKTSVVVNRALRLARKYPEEKILIITLNRALSKLIRELIEHVCQSEKREIQNIEVKSFWKLCQELLFEFDSGNIKLYDDYTHKTLEDVAEIWSEYYNCEENNDDAYIMAPVHRSLLSRGIYPNTYIKQEFDWIRSILINGDRKKYLQIDRVGRKINFTPDYRKSLLKGLEGWEEKMNFVGVIDYMGLLKPLVDFIPKIEPKYRCILVDELQDFGTSELDIIRKLVKQEENDLFLTGDIAQQVSTKHHSLKQAGITILPDNYLKIYKNYRNSREILEAAYAVYNQNVDKETYSGDDFELLNPEYANFSSPKPFIRKAYNLNSEFTYASKYLKEILKDDQKGCIALAGINYYDITSIGKKLHFPVLNGRSDLKGGNIFLSDIEQTKGFEFDRVIIINVNKDVIPNPDLPKDEWYREIAKIYVAMSRAKKELIISYSSELSPIFNNCMSLFTFNKWDDYFQNIDKVKMVRIPEYNLRLSLNNIRRMTGKQFLHTKNAIGLSTETQLKLIAVINGHTATLNGEQVEWPELGAFIDEIKSMRYTPKFNRILGKNIYKEIYNKFIK